MNKHGQILVEFGESLPDDLLDLLRRIQNLSYEISLVMYKDYKILVEHTDLVTGYCIISSYGLEEAYFPMLSHIVEKFTKLYNKFREHIERGERDRFTGFSDIISSVLNSQNHHRGFISFILDPVAHEVSVGEFFYVEYIFMYKKTVPKGFYRVIEIRDAFPSSFLDLWESAKGLEKCGDDLIARQWILNYPRDSVRVRFRVREKSRERIYVNPIAVIEFIEENKRDRFTLPCRNSLEIIIK